RGPQAASGERSVQIRRAAHHGVPIRAPAGLLDLGRDLVAPRGGEVLPLQREKAMALEVSERTVVAQHVEAVRGPLERTAWLVPAVGALADVRPKDAGSFVDDQLAGRLEQRVVRQVGDR